MEKWFDAYAKWPAMNQLLFSCVFVLVFVLVIFLFGIWVIQLFRYIAIARHGWPKDGEDGPKGKIVSASAQDMATILALLEEIKNRPISDAPTERRNMLGGLPSVGPDGEKEYPWCGTCHPTQQQSRTLPLRTGADWKAEQKQLAEEAEYQARQQAQLQHQMEQAQLPYPASPTNGKAEKPCTPTGTDGHTNMGVPNAPVAKEVPKL